MIDIIKRDIIEVLREVIVLLKEEEYGEVKELSNHVIHNAAIFQDQDSLSVAVAVYAISKIIERSLLKSDDIRSKVIDILQEAVEYLEEDDVENYRKTIKKLFKVISETDERMRMFIQDVLVQAEIKKGSKIYEHGISMARAAEILGITQWELMDFIGKTKVSEQEIPFNIEERLKFARSLFS
ncbi:MAG: hypothetical protein N3D84_01650 [Candidatus Woesearchaeota archaeon]|nr:hypothetical protein [Candidatus Woesearchaeota archaeon]